MGDTGVAEQVVLKARKRDDRKRHANARLRAEGWIPAVVYGKGEENLHVAVSLFEIRDILEHGVRMVKLDLDGEEKTALLKDVQYGTYEYELLHADFRYVTADTRVNISVPIELEGTATKAEEAGGVVEQELYELEIECRAFDIPNRITVDISGLEIGDHLTVADLPALDGVEYVTAAETPVVAAHLPMLVEEPEGEEEDAAMGLEPEVIGEDEGEETPDEESEE